MMPLMALWAWSGGRLGFRATSWSRLKECNQPVDAVLNVFTGWQALEPIRVVV